MRLGKPEFITLCACVVVIALVGRSGAQPFRGGLPACRAKLEACEEQAQQFPASGQKSCWDSSGNPIACAGTGQDGDILAGAALSYTDNEDGTITDNNTGLMWEKQSDDDSIHDRNNDYTWDNAFAMHIANLNTNPCFAGYCNWRLPNIKELISIINYENVFPSVSPAFFNNCEPLCSVTECSCTATVGYWTSTSHTFPRNNATEAWYVVFFAGNVFTADKSNVLRVRAVRDAW